MTPRIETIDPEADLDAVAEIARLSFPNPWTRAMFAQELALGRISRSYVVRTPEQRVVAFCTCWVVVDELHINTVAVHPACRRAGFARALMEHVFADAIQAGARRATLEVRRSNAAAIQLYQGLGFETEAIRRAYYPGEPAEDALVLSRAL